MKIQAQYMEAGKGEVEDITDKVIEPPPYTTGEAIAVRKDGEEQVYTIVSYLKPRNDPDSWFLILRRGGRRTGAPSTSQTLAYASPGRVMV